MDSRRCLDHRDSAAHLEVPDLVESGAHLTTSVSCTGIGLTDVGGIYMLYGYTPYMAIHFKASQFTALVHSDV